MSSYRELIENSSLYDKEIVEYVKSVSKEWETLSWRTREHKCRRLYICMLLCNTTLLSETRKRKHSTPSTSSSSTASIIYDTGFEENFFRYVNLGTDSSPGITCGKVGFDWDPSCDIIDRQEKHPIHVDLSMKKSKRFSLCLQKNTPRFVIIDPLNDTIEYQNISPMVPGHTKAMDFLAKRKSFMLEWGMRIDVTDCEGSLIDLCPTNSLLAQSTLEWIDTFWGLRFMKQPVNLEHERPLLEPLSLNKILSLMSDPRDHNRGDFCKWKGKTLPSCWVQPIQSESREDIGMCKDFIEQVGIIEENCEEKAILDAILVDKESPDSSSFKFHKVPRNQDTPLTKACGIGYKTSTRDDNCPDTCEPTYLGHPMKRMHPWISHLIKDLASACPEDWRIAFDPREDNKDLFKHPMDQVAVEAVNMIIELYKTTHSSTTAAVTVNMFSRLGGAYRCHESSGSEFVSVFPLYFLSEAGKRFIQGICLVAPQHNRNANDKITFYTIEKIKNDSRTKQYCLHALPKNVIKTSNGSLLYMRRNATNKEDCEFRTFLHSALFLVANTIGEMTIEEATMVSNTNLIRRVTNLLANNGRWFSERLSENIVMGMIGGSQEEGMLAMLRKLFMLMYAASKKRKVVMYDMGEFVEKINENCIDSPLAMYFLESFREALKLMIKTNPDTN